MTFEYISSQDATLKFDDHIVENCDDAIDSIKKIEILKRIFSDDDERRMPNIGTSIHHVEGNNMLQEYLISLPDE